MVVVVVVGPLVVAASSPDARTMTTTTNATMVTPAPIKRLRAPEDERRLPQSVSPNLVSNLGL
jgi:hypothetical protein